MKDCEVLVKGSGRLSCELVATWWLFGVLLQERAGFGR